MSYSAEVLADSPLGYWRLGEPSGTTMTDSSGNGRNGTYNAAVVLGATGLLTGDTDKAATFNGSNSYSEVAYASWMDTPTAMTVEAWIKTTSTGVRSILDRDDGGGQRPWQFRLNGAQLEFIKISGGVVTAATTGLSLNDGNIHHVVATYDGSNIRLYVDGTLVKTQSAPGSLTGTQKFQIGVNDGGVQWFSGTLDEAAFYGAVLTGTRIAAHYTAGTTTSVSASGSGSLSLSGSGAAQAAATGTGALALSATGNAGIGVSGSAALALAAAGVIDFQPASGTGSLTLAGSGAAGIGVAGTAALTLAGTGTAVGATAASGSGSLDLSAAGSATLAASGTATLTLGAIGTAFALFVTDLTNALNGRRRHARGTATVTRTAASPPPGRTFAKRYDKAIAYPHPDMVDGRPE